MDIESINNTLDAVSDNSFTSPAEAFSKVSSILEDNGIEVPPINVYEPEMMFKYISEDGVEPRYLWVVISPDEDNDTNYQIYATFATGDELDMVDNDLVSHGIDTMNDIWDFHHHLRTRKTS